MIMKRIITLIALVLLIGTNVEAKRKHLLILHTNDTHSCVMPLNPNLSDTALAGRGGYLRRIELIEQERAANPDLLLFDSGDFSQGSAYYNLFKGDVEVGLMNKMGYDAATIGNHEFDFGLDNMARLFRLAQFPIVCSNYDFSGTPLDGIVKRFIIIKRNGIRIGVFGLSPVMKGLVDDNNCKGVKFLDPVQTADEMVSVLKKKKCDMIICLSHLGWKIDEYSDDVILPKTEGIGHSHTYLDKLEYVNDKTGKPVPVDQNGKHAIFVGRIEVELNN